MVTFPASVQVTDSHTVQAPWHLRSLQVVCFFVLLYAALPQQGLAAPASPALQLVQTLDQSPHTESIAVSTAIVRNHEIGLGPLQKIGGDWQFEDSERQSGELSRQTWQVLNGYTSLELLNELSATLDNLQEATLLYACDGRRCGHGAQWASKIFGERLLYGRQDLQRYRVYAIANAHSANDASGEGDSAGAQSARMVIYASARSEDRQYLHVDILKIQPVAGALL
ncbi:MAG: DUF4892 domain-containing protein [Gammaproteobacteria bacterium]|nr:DUF4892 domain-containing protein [Gammaproteobacteria bacterium]